VVELRDSRRLGALEVFEIPAEHNDIHRGAKPCGKRMAAGNLSVLGVWTAGYLCSIAVV
jgi:hypothetical protein